MRLLIRRQPFELADFILDYQILKRLLDFLFAVFALVFLSPLLVILALYLRTRLGSPVLFFQARPGKRGKPFQMVKFRTMREAMGPDGLPLPDALRITPFGRFLRASSLDELPELWNVLKGDMSIIGPRPLLMEYLPLYDTFQARRHEVRPGITGWAQINGRNAISWDQKFFLDVWYVDNSSLLLDLRILFMTLYRVASRRGITTKDGGLMPVFRGSSATFTSDD